MLASRWQRRRRNLTVLAVLAGIILALWLGRALAARDHKFCEGRFRDLRPPEWNASLQRFVADRVARVSTTAAFFSGSDINDRKDFHTFVRQLHEEHARLSRCWHGHRVFQQHGGKPMKRRFAKKKPFEVRDQRSRRPGTACRRGPTRQVLSDPLCRTVSETRILARARPGIRCGGAGRDAPGQDYRSRDAGHLHGVVRRQEPAAICCSCWNRPATNL